MPPTKKFRVGQTPKGFSLYWEADKGQSSLPLVASGNNQAELKVSAKTALNQKDFSNAEAQIDQWFAQHFA